MHTANSLTKTSPVVISPTIPQTDKKNYRAFTLENELKALVISDQNTDKCAVALNVKIGSLSDPFEVQGLAHFCEHMLFLGSEAYPEENYFTKLLSENNGTYNAFTSASNTNYFFEARHDKLMEILDVFANFFITPLFTESATAREMNAVNSEHEQYIVNDARRLSRLQSHLAGPNHDFGKFSTGNLKTLRDDPKSKNINVRSRLLEFYHKFYSSNIMTVCLLGKEPVELLELTVKKLFSKIRNRNVTEPSWQSPWSFNQLNKIIYVEPIKDTHHIRMVWPVPDFSKSYLSKSAEYLSHLIGHESKGSILYLLKEKNMAYELAAGIQTTGDGLAHMIIKISLYKESMDHIFEVMKIVYEYIAMLKVKGPQQSIFDELKSIYDVKFRFKEVSSLEKYVSNLAMAMSLYKSTDYIKGPYMYEEFSEVQIKELIKCLVPEKMRVYVMSKTNQQPYQDKEPFYGINYTEMNMPDNYFQMLTSITGNLELHLPPKNDFLVSDFSLKTNLKDRSSGDYPKFRDIPELQITSPGYRWWFCENTLYGYPKGSIYLHLFNNSTASDPLNYIYMSLLVTILEDDLNDLLYDAYLVDLQFYVELSSSGIKLIFRGFNEKMDVLVRKVLRNFVKFEVTHNQFENAKSRLFRNLRNFEKEKPFMQAFRLMDCLTAEVRWLPRDLLETEPHVSLKSYKQFFDTVMCTLSVEGLVYGNFTKMTSELIYKDVQNILKTLIHRPLHSSFIPITRQILLPENSNYVFQMKAEHSSQSALLVYLQGLKRNTKNDVVTKLIDNIMQDPFFDTLRTKEQLGYVVSNNTKTSNSIMALRFLVQSDKSPEFVNKRVNNFLIDFYDTLKSMPEEKFETHRAGLISKIMEKPKDMWYYFNKLLVEFDQGHYNFDRVHQQRKALNEVTKEEVLKFYENLIHPESSTLKKLSVHIVSTQTHQLHQYNMTESCDEDDQKVAEPVETTKAVSVPIELPQQQIATIVTHSTQPTDPVWYTFDQTTRFKRSMTLSELYEPPVALSSPQPKL